MRILPYSDLHTEFASFTPPDDLPDHDVVVIAGDLVNRMRRGPALIAAMGLDRRPVVYIGGNHEHYGRARDHELTAAREAAKAFPNIHVLQDDEVVIDGVRFLGATLWTDFRLFGDDKQRNAMEIAGGKVGGMNDFQRIRLESRDWGRFRPVDACTEHMKTVSWLRSKFSEPFDGRTVVVTHHAPSMLSAETGTENDILTAAYASPLDDLVAGSGASLWLHGHIHQAKDYAIGGTRVLSNPRGYVQTVGYGRQRRVVAQPTGFDPRLVVDLGVPPPCPDRDPHHDQPA